MLIFQIFQLKIFNKIYYLMINNQINIYKKHITHLMNILNKFYNNAVFNLNLIILNFYMKLLYQHYYNKIIKLNNIFINKLIHLNKQLLINNYKI